MEWFKTYLKSRTLYVLLLVSGCSGGGGGGNSVSVNDPPVTEDEPAAVQAEGVLTLLITDALVTPDRLDLALTGLGWDAHALPHLPATPRCYETFLSAPG